MQSAVCKKAPKKVVVIGNGMAAGRLLDELLARKPRHLEITVVGDEVQGSYNRIMLSPVLAGATDVAAIIQKPAQWYAEQGIRFIAGVRATEILREARCVRLSDGAIVPYDELVLATGSRPASIPARNQQLEHIYSFRTLDDVAAITQRAHGVCHAVVVGGGLLGLEAAYGLACQGVEVTLVHRSEWLLNRQLDAAAGACLQRVMEARNIRFVLGREVVSFEAKPGQSQVASVRLSDGSEQACQLAIIATGITPNSELGEQAGLSCQRAILVDSMLQSSDPAISALGECCEHAGHTYGLVEPIWRQCCSLAARLCGEAAPSFSNQPIATKLKVSGVQVFSAGEHLTQDGLQALVLSDPHQHIYRKLLLDHGRIVGIVLFGDTRDGQHYFELMQQGVDVSAVRDQLLFGQACYDAATLNWPEAAVAAA